MVSINFNQETSTYEVNKQHSDHQSIHSLKMASGFLSGPVDIYYSHSGLEPEEFELDCGVVVRIGTMLALITNGTHLEWITHLEDEIYWVSQIDDCLLVVSEISIQGMSIDANRRRSTGFDIITNFTLKDRKITVEESFINSIKTYSVYDFLPTTPKVLSNVPDRSKTA